MINSVTFCVSVLTNLLNNMSEYKYKRKFKL